MPLDDCMLSETIKESGYVMKKVFKRVLVYIMLVAILMVSVGCSGKIEQPPMYKQLSSVMGKKLEEVCTVLGVSEEDMTQRADSFTSIPLTVEYEGVSFAVCLYTWGEDGLSAFMYEAIYTGEPEKAAKAAAAVKNALMKVMVKAGIDEENTISNKTVELSELTEETFEKRFSGLEVFKTGTIWDLTEIAEPEVQACLEKAKGVYEEAGISTPPHFLFEFDIDYTPDTDEVAIRMKYSIGR